MEYNNKHNKKPPLQFKRGSAKAFRLANPLLMSGQPAFETDTKKLKIGDGKSRYLELPYIGSEHDGKDGKSAYQLWKENGNNGTVEDFLESLVGPAGKSTYEIWLSLGNEGSMADFIEYLRGDSAFEIWKAETANHDATEEDYIAYTMTTTWGTF